MSCLEQFDLLPNGCDFNRIVAAVRFYVLSRMWFLIWYKLIKS